MRKPEEFSDFPRFDIPRRYRALCKHVVDGDTYDFLVDLGFNQYSYITVRLAGVDTAEIFSGSMDERSIGLAVKGWVSSRILNKPCILTTYKDSTTFGRYVADVWYPRESDGNWLDLGGEIVLAGLAGK